jgi:hypothetical protein
MVGEHGLIAHTLVVGLDDEGGGGLAHAGRFLLARFA